MKGLGGRWDGTEGERGKKGRREQGERGEIEIERDGRRVGCLEQGKLDRVNEGICMRLDGPSERALHLYES